MHSILSLLSLNDYPIVPVSFTINSTTACLNDETPPLSYTKFPKVLGYISGLSILSTGLFPILLLEWF